MYVSSAFHLYADDTQAYGWCQPTDANLLQANIGNVWMCRTFSNKLHLNALNIVVV